MMDEPLPFEEKGRKGGREKSKRRSSILKQTGNRGALQDINPNVVGATAEKWKPDAAEGGGGGGGGGGAKRKSRRVSFSRSNQVKEFQTGSQTLTIWNSTYEEDHSSVSQNQTGPNVASARKPPPAGLTAAISPSKRQPLNIAIPAKGNGEKFLPADNQMDARDILQSSDQLTVDSNNFLSSLAIGGKSDSSDVLDDKESSFVQMLEKFQGKENLEEEISGPAKSVDTEGFLANLQDGFSNKDERNETQSMDMTMVHNFVSKSFEQTSKTSRTEVGGHGATNQTRLDFTMGMDMTCVSKVSVPDSPEASQCPDRSFVAGMDMTCHEDVRLSQGHLPTMEPPTRLELTCADESNQACPGPSDMSVCHSKSNNAEGATKTSGLEMTCVDTDYLRVEDSKMSMEANGDLRQTTTVSMDMTCVTKFSVSDNSEVGRNLGQSVAVGMDMTCHEDLRLSHQARDPPGTMEPMTAGLELTCVEENNRLARLRPGDTSACHDSSDVKSSGLEMTCAGGDSSKIPESDDIDMEMTFNPGQQQQQQLQPQYPVEAGQGSNNNSFDGGATATMKFTGLALANNTLILPRKESQEDDDDDDMTRLPVQIINYDPSCPVHVEQQKQAEKRASPVDTQTAAAERIETDNMVQLLEAKTAKLTSGSLLTTVASENISNEVFLNDVTSFCPTSESTRAFRINVAPEGFNVTPEDFHPPQLDAKEAAVGSIADVTSFIPSSESTRAFKFPVAINVDSDGLGNDLMQENCPTQINHDSGSLSRENVQTDLLAKPKPVVNTQDGLSREELEAESQANDVKTPQGTDLQNAETGANEIETDIVDLSIGKEQVEGRLAGINLEPSILDEKEEAGDLSKMETAKTEPVINEDKISIMNHSGRKRRSASPIESCAPLQPKSVYSSYSIQTRISEEQSKETETALVQEINAVSMLVEHKEELFEIPATSQPQECSLPEPTSVVPEPSSGVSEPTSVGPDLTSVVSESNSVLPGSTSIMPKLASVLPETISVVPEPTSVEPEPTSVAPEPTSVTPEPTSVAPEPTSIVPELTSVAPEPISVVPEPTSIAPEPTSIAPEPTSVAPETKSSAAADETAASNNKKRRSLSPPGQQTQPAKLQRTPQTESRTLESTTKLDTARGPRTIFEELSEKQQQSHTSWRFGWYDPDSDTAGFSWMERSLMLVLKLGARLSLKTQRKSLSQPVFHYPIKKIIIKSVDTANNDFNLETAHFIIKRKFPEFELLKMCPNTCSLSTLLANISKYVSAGYELMESLDAVEAFFYPYSVQDNVVTIGFCSVVLQWKFRVSVDLTEGLSAAPRKVELISVLGSSYTPSETFVKNLALQISPGPRFIKEFANRIELNIKKKEQEKLIELNKT